MKLDLDDLRRHYASLSDEGLLDLDRDDLVEAAQQLYDEEIDRRGLTAWAKAEQHAAPAIETGPEPEWLPDASCACTFETAPGKDSAPEADEARATLEAAGIPCHITVRRLENDGQREHYDYDVMVPSALNLHAMSILDRDIFNPKLEEDWRKHFEELSDDELDALDAQLLCAGLLDRVERLKRAYEDEIARRQTDV